MEPNTAEEFDTLPHVILTQGGEWDPTALDHMLTDDDDWVSKVKRDDDQECDSPFDNRGECKHREPVKAGVQIQLDRQAKILTTLKSTFITTRLKSTFMQTMQPDKHIKRIRKHPLSTKCVFMRARACLTMKLKPLRKRKTRPKRTLKRPLLQQRPSPNLLIAPSVEGNFYMCQLRRLGEHLLLRLRMQLPLCMGPRQTKLSSLQALHSTFVEERKQQQLTPCLPMCQQSTRQAMRERRCSWGEAHCTQIVMDSVLQVNSLMPCWTTSEKGEIRPCQL